MNIQVQEYKNEVIFLRKIKEGGASKSYGIHVAKLAGIPNSVIKRSQIILNNFTDNKINLHFNNKEQLPLFDNLKNEKVDFINDIQLDISSTIIRENADNLDKLKPIVDQKVLMYILKNKLYK